MRAVQAVLVVVVGAICGTTVWLAAFSHNAGLVTVGVLLSVAGICMVGMIADELADR